MTRGIAVVVSVTEVLWWRSEQRRAETRSSGWIRSRVAKLIGSENQNGINNIKKSESRKHDTIRIGDDDGKTRQGDGGDDEDEMKRGTRAEECGRRE